MEYRDYLEVTRQTAIYPKDQARSYLQLGLLSEVGEVAGKLKKNIRDGLTYSDDDILSELGDVLWYVVRLTDECGWLAYEDGWPLAKGVYFSELEDIIDAAFSLSPESTILVLAHYTEENFARPLSYLAQINADKLLSRKDRGVIQGSGDSR